MRKTERGLSMNLGDRVHAERKIGLFNRREHIEHKKREIKKTGTFNREIIEIHERGNGKSRGDGI
jgi:hypothetical protein